MRSNSNARISSQAGTITTATNGHLNSMIEEFNREYAHTKDSHNNNSGDNP